MFILAACYQIFQEKTRPQFRQHVVMHIPGVSKSHLDKIGIDEETKLIAWNTISNIYYNEGRWKEAKKLGVQVMETRKRVLG